MRPLRSEWQKDARWVDEILISLDIQTRKWKVALAFKGATLVTHDVGLRSEIFTVETLAEIEKLEQETMGNFPNLPFSSVRFYHSIRFKSSDVSGSEWRTSGCADFASLDGRYKANRYFWWEDPEGNVFTPQVYTWISELRDAANSVAAETRTKLRLHKCNQVGCSKESAYFYRVHDLICPIHHSGETCPREPLCNDWASDKIFRGFCAKHGTRGDCNFDDSDDGYARVDPQIGRVLPFDTPKAPQPDPSVVSVPLKMVIDLSK